MSTTKMSELDQCREMLKNHILEPVASDQRVTAYYMKDPAQGRMCSTLIVFTPEGIALMGDLTPEHNGSTSCMGYSLAWFAGELSDGYLCEKFLKTGWHAELAKEELERWLKDDERELTDDQRDAIRSAMGSVNDNNVHEMMDELESAGFSMDDGPPGCGYDPRERRILVAIQERFSQLYRESASK